MKKVLLGLFALSAVAFAYEGTNVYLKAGIDPYGRFKEASINGNKLNKKDRKDVGYEFAIEATETVLPEFEVGLGLAYQDHGRPKVSNDLNEKLPRFRSVPLYAVAKYNIPLESEFKPYLKADLGYSFNLKNSKTYSEEDERLKISYKDGMYWGLGAGVEYENFVADLMYKMNYGEVKCEYTSDEGSGSISPKINYGRITLSVGYKFNF